MMINISNPEVFCFFKIKYPPHGDGDKDSLYRQNCLGTLSAEKFIKDSCINSTGTK